MQIDKQSALSALAALGLAAWLVLGFNIDLFGWAYTPPQADKQPTTAVATTSAVVQSVVDGDTLNVEVGTSSESVRLIGIDAPEIRWPSDENDLSEPEEECFGFASRDKLADLVGTSSITLVSDPYQPAYDDYDRRLAYIYTADGSLVNQVMLASGHGRELTVGAGYRLQEEFRSAETTARDNDRGLWAACREGDS